MKEEIISIIHDIPFNEKWISPREEACLTALYMYSNISEKFRVDSKYGAKFVAENQQLIGQLVQAAMQKLHADISSKEE